MAAPNYITDLISALLGNDGTETWDESSNAAYDDGGAMVDDGNLYYINSECVSAQFTKTGIGTIIGDIGSNITVPANGAILIHHLWAAPPALQVLATGGQFAWIGSSLGDAKIFYTSGKDAPPAPEGGWATFAVDPAQTHDDVVGTLPTTYRYIGGGVKATLQARGNPHAVQAIRYGRCEQEYTLGEIANPATFGGYAAIDSTTTTRYNLLQPIKGGYLQRGLVSLGTAATLVYFEDSNVNISLADDRNVSVNFNRWEINNASSTIKMTAVSISALGTVSKGQFEMIDNAALTFTSCTFTDMSTFIFLSNASIISTIFRRTDQVTQGGATFTDCIFDKLVSVASLVVSSLADVTGCTFNSDGSNHAIDLGTISADVTMSWNNNLNDYAADNGSTGNEAILVNVNNGITLTINVVDGATTPKYYNTGTGIVNVIAGQKSFKFTLNPSITGYEWRIYSVTAIGSLVGAVELAGQESATLDNQTYTYSYSVDTFIAVQILGVDYVDEPTFYTLKNSNQDVTINLTKDSNN